MLEPLLPRLKREIAARMAELRPLVDEAERLEAAKEALLAEAAAVERATSRRVARGSQPRVSAFPELNGATASSFPAARANGSSADVASADVASEDDRDGRDGRGANQAAILAVVEERPGVSIAEIASVTKIAKPTVATTVSKLKREGVLADEAGGVKLASRQPLTLSQVA
jgi:MarR family